MNFTAPLIAPFVLVVLGAWPAMSIAQVNENDKHQSEFSLSDTDQDWSQWLGSERDGVWREAGILKETPEGGLKEVWRMPIAGGFAGPAVAGNRVFVTDYLAKEGDQTFVSSKRSLMKGVERVHCLNVETGSSIWTHERECDYNISFALGPRVTPTVDGDRVYTLGAEGLLLCLNANDGKIVWKKRAKEGVRTGGSTDVGIRWPSFSP